MDLNSGSSSFLNASVVLLVLMIRLGSSCTSQPILGCIAYDTASSAMYCNCIGCYDASYSLTPNSAVDSFSCCQSSHVSACQTCAGSATFICVKCLPTYGLSTSNTCVNFCSTINNCLDCFYDYVCLVCDSGYTPQLGACVTCSTRMSLCITCNSSAALCFACINSSYAVNISSYPNSCVSCGNFITSCLACTNSTFCTQCQSDQHILIGGRCDPCHVPMPYCLVCYGSSILCYQCNTSQMGVTSTSPNACELCSIIDGCLSCSGMSACLVCNATTYLNAGACIICSTNLVGCSQCNGSNLCLNCLNNSYLHNNATNLCDPCNTLLADCLTCSSLFRCLTCRSSFIPYPSSPNPIAICRKCSELIMGCYHCLSSSLCTYCMVGNIRGNGCSKVVGCLSINFSVVNLQANCLLCNTTQYFEIPIYGICQCLVGKIMGDFCGEQTGCTKMAFRNRTLVCVACNYTAGFVYNLTNAACICRQKYILEGGECVEICGDGFLFDLPCDDGNIEDGDGCSSNCQLESNYSCSGGSPISPTHCIFKARIAISLNKITRVPGANSLQIYLDITPFSNLLSKFNISSYLNFSVTPTLNFSLSAATFVNKQLVINIDYFQSVTDYAGKVDLSFDATHVRSPKTACGFKLSDSNGDALEYEVSIWKDETIEIAAYILGMAAIVISFAGSLGFGMIGVETLYTFQLSYLLMAHSSSFRRSFSSLQPLVKAMGLFPATNRSSLITAQPSVNFALTTDFLDNYLLVGLLQIIGLMLYWIIKAYHAKQYAEITADRKERIVEQQTKLKKKHSTTEHILYDFLLFFLFAGFQLHFQQALIVQTYKQAKSTPIENVLFIVVLTISSSIVLFTQLVRDGRQEMGKGGKIYVRLYIANMIIVCLLSLLSFLKYFVCLPFAIVLLSFLQILSALQLPYRHNFHNISIGLNFIFIFALSGWLLLQNAIPSLSEYEPQIVVAYLVCLLIVILLALFRCILVFKTIWQTLQKSRETEMKIQQREEEKFMEEHLMTKMISTPIQLERSSSMWKFRKPLNSQMKKNQQQVEREMSYEGMHSRHQKFLHHHKFRELNE